MKVGTLVREIETGHLWYIDEIEGREAECTRMAEEGGEYVDLGWTEWFPLEELEVVPVDERPVPAHKITKLIALALEVKGDGAQALREFALEIQEERSAS